MEVKRQNHHALFQGMSMALIAISLLLVVCLALGSAWGFLLTLLDR